MMDLHTHLDLYKNPYSIADEANDRNKFTLCVTTSPRAWKATSKAFSNLENVSVALGMHPEIVDKKQDELDLMIANVSNVRYIGEIGMDGLPQNKGKLVLQKRILEAVLGECQRQQGRVLSIHSRRAEMEVLGMLEAHPNAGIPILHWFSGSRSAMHKAVDMGCYFSVNRLMVTSAHGRALVAELPKNRVLPETDGPFAQINMQPLFPWECEMVARELSSIWRIPVDEVMAGFDNVLSDVTNSRR